MLCHHNGNVLPNVQRVPGPGTGGPGADSLRPHRVQRMHVVRARYHNVSSMQTHASSASAQLRGQSMSCFTEDQGRAAIATWHRGRAMQLLIDVSTDR
jgi:hypothetical protein